MTDRSVGKDGCRESDESGENDVICETSESVYCCGSRVVVLEVEYTRPDQHLLLGMAVLPLQLTDEVGRLGTAILDSSRIPGLAEPLGQAGRVGHD